MMTGVAHAQQTLTGPFCVTLGGEEPRTIYRFTLSGPLDAPADFLNFSVTGIRYEDEPGVSDFDFSPITGSLFVSISSVNPFGSITGGFFRISVTEHLGEAFDGSAETVFDFDFTFTGTWLSQFWRGTETEEDRHSIDGGNAEFLFGCPSDNAFPAP
jgi:hypothetical protein